MWEGGEQEEEEVEEGGGGEEGEEEEQEEEERGGEVGEEEEEEEGEECEGWQQFYPKRPDSKYKSTRRQIPECNNIKAVCVCVCAYYLCIFTFYVIPPSVA